jgi:hypothetical protein
MPNFGPNLSSCSSELKATTFFTLIFIAANVAAQDITVAGKVTDKKGHNTLMNIMVVDQRSANGTFAGANGEFTIKIQRTDTLMITARDFSVKKFCFRDSAVKNTYFVVVRLDSLHFELSDVYVHPQHNLPEIHKDIEDLNKIPNTDTYKDVSAMSPITLLYERFSRIEQSKRKVAQMEDDEKRRNVLKDLLHLYIKYDIIKLDDKSFDDFISYCNLPDDFIKQSTDYELIMAIKQKYQSYIRNYGKDYYNGK